MATVIILLFVVALCVYAPCACLWRRHRTEFAVNCPITASQKGMCSKCYLHSNAATQKMTYEERPRHVSVTMATSDSQHRPISGNFSAQVNIIIDDVITLSSGLGCSKPDQANLGLARILIFSFATFQWGFCLYYNCLSFSFEFEKSKLHNTFNPRLALTGLWTARP